MKSNYIHTTARIERLKTRVTIITPTYNRADLVQLTIRSVLNQTFKDYTYIILDDGSTDNTEKIVRSLIKDNRNCFYLYHDNIGEAETVNAGWRLSNSEYFLQVNSDDIIEPDLVSEMVRVLDKNPKAVVAYPDFKIINQSGETVEDFKNKDWNFIEALSAFSCYAAAPGTIIRKSAFRHLDKIKDSNYRYINDVKMLWSMALRGDFIHVPKSLASWRSHTGGISTNRYKSIGEVMAWADEYFSQQGLPARVKAVETKCRQTIDRYCLSLIGDSAIEGVVVDFIKPFSKRYQHMVEKNELLVSKNNSLTNEMNSLTARNNELTQKIERVEQSISWKVTRPLREISGFLRRLMDAKA